MYLWDSFAFFQLSFYEGKRLGLSLHSDETGSIHS